MTCEVCGAVGAVEKRATKSFGSGDSLVVIEDIPVVHCPTCHESYVTAETSRQLDRIRKNRRQVATARPILVASFEVSAA
jgi:YgiT-type zinc finger domain-containing protein